MSVFVDIHGSPSSRIGTIPGAQSAALRWEGPAHAHFIAGHQACDVRDFEEKIADGNMVYFEKKIVELVARSPRSAPDLEAGRSEQTEMGLKAIGFELQAEQE